MKTSCTCGDLMSDWLKPGARVYVPGRAARNLPERRGILLSVEKGGGLVQHFDGNRYGWMSFEMVPGVWGWWKNLSLRLRLWWILFRRPLEPYDPTEPKKGQG